MPLSSQDLEVPEGDTFPFAVALEVATGTTLVGASATYSVWRSPYRVGEPLLELSGNDARLIQAAGAWTLDVALDLTRQGPLKAGTYWHKVRIVLADGSARTAMRGKLIVTP